MRPRANREPAPLRERLQHENGVRDGNVLQEVFARLEVGQNRAERLPVAGGLAVGKGRERGGRVSWEAVAGRPERVRMGGRLVVASEDELGERGRVRADRRTASGRVEGEGPGRSLDGLGGVAGERAPSAARSAAPSCLAGSRPSWRGTPLPSARTSRRVRPGAPA